MSPMPAPTRTLRSMLRPTPRWPTPPAPTQPEPTGLAPTRSVRTFGLPARPMSRWTAGRMVGLATSATGQTRRVADLRLPSRMDCVISGVGITKPEDSSDANHLRISPTAHHFRLSPAPRLARNMPYLAKDENPPHSAPTLIHPPARNFLNR